MLRLCGALQLAALAVFASSCMSSTNAADVEASEPAHERADQQSTDDQEALRLHRRVHHSSRVQHATARGRRVASRSADATPPPPIRDSLNALDFGAKGDCFYTAAKPAWQVCSDDAPALQAAIDAAQQQRRALFVPAGSYGINSSLVVHSNANASDGYKFGPLRMMGEGKSLTTIEAMAPMLAVLELPMAKLAPPGYAAPHEDIEIEHIGLSAANKADCKSLAMTETLRPTCTNHTSFVRLLSRSCHRALQALEYLR